MEIVIKIDDDMVKAIEQGSFGAKYNTYDLVGCIMNGTPLENILDKTFDKLDKTIVDALDKSENQVECQTLRWVLDVISEETKGADSD